MEPPPPSWSAADVSDANAQEYGVGAGLPTASGRSSLFCCLSCGMPFAFPDAAYTSDDKEVRDVLTLVHRIRDEIRHSEPGRGGSTALWQPQKSHYIHRFVCFFWGMRVAESETNKLM